MAEVVERRRAWHQQAGEASMESWPAHDLDAWLGLLRDAVDTVGDSTRSPSETDPRAALIDVIAVCAAWIDQMGAPPPVH